MGGRRSRPQMAVYPNPAEGQAGKGDWYNNLQLSYIVLNVYSGGELSRENVMRAKLLLSVVIIMATVSITAAQKHEIAFTSGGLKVGERVFNFPQPGFLKFKTGFTYQFNYAQRIIDAKIASLYWEVPVAVTPKTRVTGTNALSPSTYSSLFFSPGLKVKLFP